MHCNLVFRLAVERAFQQVAQVGRCVLASAHEFVDFSFFFLLVKVLDGQSDLAINGINLKNGSFQSVTNLGEIFRAVDFFLCSVRKRGSDLQYPLPAR